MATAPTTLINFTPGSATSPLTTASFTPVAGTRLVVFGGAGRNAVITVKPTISNSGGLTFTELGNVKTSTFSNPDLWLVGWISSVIPASPAAMTVTITNASANAVVGCVTSVLAADTDGTVAQVAYGEDLAAGDPSVTLPALPGANNLVIGCTWMSGANAVTKPTGYTILFDNAPANTAAKRATYYYDNAGAAQANACASTNVRSILMVVELGVTTAPAGRAKVWNGSAWVQKPAKVWNGSAWVTKPVKIWNGSAWT